MPAPLRRSGPDRPQRPPTVAAAFQRESYAPGRRAILTIFSGARRLRLQILRAGAERMRTTDDITMNGVGVTRPRPDRQQPGPAEKSPSASAPGRAASTSPGWKPGRPGRLRALRRPTEPLASTEWRSSCRRSRGRPTTCGTATGTASATAGTRAGHPDRGLPHRKTVRLGRPFLNRGVPSRFRLYDLPFLQWLSRTHREVDYLAQRDIERAAARPTSRGRTTSSSSPATTSTSRSASTTSSRGTATSAATSCSSPRTTSSGRWAGKEHSAKTKQWRDLGRPEAALIGVQYRGMDTGSHRGRWILRRARAGRWIFAGTGWAPVTSSSGAASRSTARPRLTPQRAGCRGDPEPVRPRHDGADDVLRDGARREGLRRRRVHARRLRASARCLGRARQPLGATREAVMTHYRRVSAIGTNPAMCRPLILLTTLAAVGLTAASAQSSPDCHLGETRPRPARPCLLERSRSRATAEGWATSTS